MRTITICGSCESPNIKYLGKNQCYCFDCQKNRASVDKTVMTPFERTPGGPR